LAWSLAKFDEGLKLVDPLKKKISLRKTIHESDLVHTLYPSRWEIGPTSMSRVNRKNEYATTLDKRKKPDKRSAMSDSGIDLVQMIFGGR
jgi:hypothetical protein